MTSKTRKQNIKSLILKNLMNYPQFSPKRFRKEQNSKKKKNGINERNNKENNR